MSSSKLVIFDFDGVLCDSLSFVLQSTTSIAQSLGFHGEISAEALAQLDNVTFPEIGRLAGIATAMIPEYQQRVFTLFGANAEAVKAFDGVSEMLQILAASHQLAVVTANHPRVVKSVLATINASTLFGDILGGDTPGDKASKITTILQRTSNSIHNAWMVGDSRSDIREAKKAGVASIAVTWGWQPEQALREIGPDHVVHSPLELAAILTQEGIRSEL